MHWKPRGKGEEGATREVVKSRIPEIIDLRGRVKRYKS